jgi:hypothetical protein
MMKHARVVDEGLEIARDSYTAAIRLTEDMATLEELEVQIERDERLRSGDREYLLSLVEARTYGL